ncbi:MAG: FAD-binding oxidoreductase [Nanoarchaeota archaeon]|mgnify:CR=1 FL=1
MGLPMASLARKRTFELVKVERHTPTVAVFTLTPVKHEVITFTPGMFVSLSFEHDGTKYGPKPYSVSSSPLVKDAIELTIRKEGFFTQAFFKLQEGAHVDIMGPYGKFVLNEPLPQDVCLLAAGTGIAPLMSMLRHIQDADKKSRCTLIFSCKTQHDIIFEDELEHRAQKHDDFSYVQTLTQEPAESDWQGHRARINTRMVKEHVKNLKGAHFYICGPQGFVQSVQELLDELNVPHEHVFFERWG